MGYASCLEDNIDKVYDNWHMRGGYRPEPRKDPEPIFVTGSPPLQPAIATVVIPPQPRPAPETIAERKRAQHEKHVLAIYELMPGSRWRH